MRTIIAGSRGCTNKLELLQAVHDCGWSITEVISGTASGADQMGEWWANRNSVPCRKMPADWNKYGKSAGYKRNVEMANVADALIAIWDGKSPGTRHMINIAKSKELKVHVHVVK